MIWCISIHFILAAYIDYLVSRGPENPASYPPGREYRDYMW